MTARRVWAVFEDFDPCREVRWVFTTQELAEAQAGEGYEVEPVWLLDEAPREVTIYRASVGVWRDGTIGAGFVSDAPHSSSGKEWAHIVEQEWGFDPPVVRMREHEDGSASVEAAGYDADEVRALRDTTAQRLSAERSALQGQA